MCGHTIAPEPNIIYRQKGCVVCASLKEQDLPGHCADPKSVQRANYHKCPKCIENPSALSQLGVTINFPEDSPAAEEDRAAKNLAALDQAKKGVLAKAVKHSYQQLNTPITSQEQSQYEEALQHPNAVHRTPVQNLKCLLKLRELEAKLAKRERLIKTIHGRRGDQIATRLRYRIRSYKNEWKTQKVAATLIPMSQQGDVRVEPQKVDYELLQEEAMQLPNAGSRPVVKNLELLLKVQQYEAEHLQNKRRDVEQGKTKLSYKTRKVLSKLCTYKQRWGLLKQS